MGGGGGKTTITLDENGLNPKGTSFASTVSTIFKGFMGAGALSLPLLFMTGGVASTSAFLWVLGAIALYAIFALVQVSNLIILTEQRQRMITRIKRQNDPNAARALPFEIIPGVTDKDMIPADRNGIDVPSFSQCGNVAVGPFFGGFLVELALAICQVGICIAYVIFVSTNLHESIGLLSRVGWILAMTVPIGLLLLIPDLKKLSFIGVLGNIVYLVTVIVIIYLGIRDFCCIERKDVNWNTFSEYGSIFGTCSFALEGIAIILPIKAGMKNSKQFAPVMNLSMFLILGVYWGFGLGSYLLFGAHTKSPIISSLPPELVLTKIAKIALSASIFFSFPLQFFPIREFIMLVLNKKYYVDERSLQKSHDIMLYNGTLPDSSQKDGDIDTCDDLDTLGFDNTPPINSDDTTVMLPTKSSDSSSYYPDEEISPSKLTIITPKNHHSSNNNDDLDDLAGLKSPKTPFPRDQLEDDENYEKYHKTQEEIDAAHNAVYNWSVFLRFLILSIISFVALIFPNFKLIIALFGSFANSSLAYIFPTVFWLWVAALGRKMIMNSPKYIELSKSPFTFQISSVYYYTRFGDKIDLESILDRNCELLDEYSRQHFISELVKEGEGNYNGLETSPLNSRSGSYGSFEDDQKIPNQQNNNTIATRNRFSPQQQSTTVIDLYNHDDQLTNNPSSGYLLPTTSSPGASLLQNKVASTPNDTMLDVTTTRSSMSLSVQVTRHVHLFDQDGYDVKPMTRCGFIMGWAAFPATVAIVGIVASVIGVIDSIKDIIHEFSH